MPCSGRGGTNIPRNGSGVYSLPNTYEAVSGETIEAQQHNDPLEDLQQDANAARPIVAGGTGGTTAQEALTALFAGGKTIDDDELLIVDPADPTKRARIDAGNVTAGQTRVLTMPDANLDLTGLATQVEGDVLYRGASAWQRLPKGAAGQTLRQNAALTAPEWASGWEPLAKATPVAAATVDFTDLSAYYALRITGFLTPATGGGVNLLIRTSTDNGATFDAGGSDYGYTYDRVSSTTTSAAAASDSAVLINPVDNVGNDTATAGINFVIHLVAFNKTTRGRLIWHAGWGSSAGNSNSASGWGARLNATARDALRLVFSSGNVANGLVQVEGLRG